jgi:hypothetical protein
MLTRIRNLFDPGSGMEKFGSGINIPDPGTRETDFYFYPGLQPFFIGAFCQKISPRSCSMRESLTAVLVQWELWRTCWAAPRATRSTSGRTSTSSETRLTNLAWYPIAQSVKNLMPPGYVHNKGFNPDLHRPQILGPFLDPYENIESDHALFDKSF